MRLESGVIPPFGIRVKLILNANGIAKMDPMPEKAATEVPLEPFKL